MGLNNVWKGNWAKFGERSPWFVQVASDGRGLYPQEGDLVRVYDRKGRETRVEVGTVVKQAQFGNVYAIRRKIYADGET